ncbi:hypothetical protein OFM36_37865, partial [Escherichia coli]|nr:hypothetical protein [Escherichia coli]
LDGAEFVRNGFNRIHAFDEINSFLESLLHFFVIESICGRILKPLSVNKRNSAPGPHKFYEIGLFAGGSGPRTLFTDGAAV